ncbi:MAG TPA: metal-dependent hydrolase [Polyangiales bacterium]|nr:metal-dependent hydrolase [Polyangiales bacterium]
MAIVSRDLKFELSDTIPVHWSPDQREFSHVANAFMAALPYLEPYFIHNIRTAAETLTDPTLKAEAEGFIHQEARHAQQHRAWNQVLQRRYPGFDALEDALKRRLSESKQRDSLAFRLAYTSGYEAITYQIVCFIMANRHAWLKGADPRVVAMLTWHAAEEVEHKCVAFDVYQAVHGGYFMRVLGLVSALVRSVQDIRAMTRLMLSADGLWDDPESRRRVKGVRRAFAKGLLPPLFSYLMPWYRPRAHADPAIIEAWLESHSSGRDLRALDLDALDSL